MYYDVKWCADVTNEEPHYEDGYTTIPDKLMTEKNIGDQN